MRRAVVVCGVLTAVAMLLVACVTAPPGTDQDLVNGWPMLPAAALVAPVAPSCYAPPGGTAATDVTKWPPPVACTEPHSVELVSLGQFTGADAERPIPPTIGGSAMRTAYAECAVDANALLGADWRTGRVSLSVDLPYPALWDAGARWYRCDLQAMADVNRFTPMTRTASMRGTLQPGGELAGGCVAVTQPDGGAPTDIGPIRPVASCAERHDAEFAGMFEPPDGPYPGDAATRTEMNLAGCRPKIAVFVGVPFDANFRSRTGLITMPFDKAAWELGNRAVRCYVWPPKPVAGTLKDAGTRGLPINVA